MLFFWVFDLPLDRYMETFLFLRVKCLLLWTPKIPAWSFDSHFPARSACNSAGHLHSVVRWWHERCFGLWHAGDQSCHGSNLAQLLTVWVEKQQLFLKSFISFIHNIRSPFCQFSKQLPKPREKHGIPKPWAALGSPGSRPRFPVV